MYTKEQKDGYWLIKNEGGATLGVANLELILAVDGYAFKDLNRNGVLDPYEDWRLPWEDRIADLVSKLEVDAIAGLMLYSSQQNVSKTNPLAAFTQYGGTDKENIWELSSQLELLLKEEHIRHITLLLADDAEVAARWNNNMQAFVESLDYGIPVNISTDPRHSFKIKKAEFNMGGSGKISIWPDEIGLAATFSPELVKEFGKIAASEYRAMGITTALSPQIDLATEPRWNRFDGTFGEDPTLATEMARAYCDGIQTSTGDDEIQNGWGYQSVNAMVKHWPGGGTGEGGRDAHFGFGKYGVYPGSNFEEHLKPFVDGAFQLDGPTSQSSAVMPYYSISYDQDTENHENVGNSFSKYIITDLLRQKYGYDGVVCTDWGITFDAADVSDMMTGKCWGAEDLSLVERHYKIIMAGVDQFGGNTDITPILEAYKLGEERLGEAVIKKRFELSARRILRNIFRTGIVENPYQDHEKSVQLVANTEYVEKGREAQRKSVILLKNKDNLLPLAKGTKVYIPNKVKKEHMDWFGQMQPEQHYPAVDIESAKRHFIVVETPLEADVALVFMDSPTCQVYREGYLPVTLQYRSYTASTAREKSIAGEGRSYKGETNTAENDNELDILLETKQAMGDKPVVALLSMTNPTVVAEFEPCVDALVADFSVEKEILLELIVGEFEPSGLLPCQIPKDMMTVEAQNEDVPFDMIPYTDECNNNYDFTFGLSWAGVIQDERVAKYKK